jgi:putative transposase
MNRPERLALVDHDDPALPVVAQCRLLKVARSTLYYQPVPVSTDDLAMMRRMDELYLARPFYGSRRMVAVLRREGWAVNRKRVRRLMRLMGLWAIYQKPNTSRQHPEHGAEGSNNVTRDRYMDTSSLSAPEPAAAVGDCWRSSFGFPPDR